MLRHGNHKNAELQADWIAFGADAFEFRILFALTDRPALYSLVENMEKRCIDQVGERRYNVVDEQNVNKNWRRRAI